MMVPKAYHIKVAYFKSKSFLMGSIAITMRRLNKKKNYLNVYYRISVSDKRDSDYTAEWLVTVVDLHKYSTYRARDYF
jgi:hypothetical protein